MTTTFWLALSAFFWSGLSVTRLRTHRWGLFSSTFAIGAMMTPQGPLTNALGPTAGVSLYWFGVLILGLLGSDKAVYDREEEALFADWQAAQCKGDGVDLGWPERPPDGMGSVVSRHVFNLFSACPNDVLAGRVVWSILLCALVAEATSMPTAAFQGTPVWFDGLGVGLTAANLISIWRSPSPKDNHLWRRTVWAATVIWAVGGAIGLATSEAPGIDSGWWLVIPTGLALATSRRILSWPAPSYIQTSTDGAKSFMDLIRGGGA